MAGLDRPINSKIGPYGVAAQLNVDHSHVVSLAPPPVLVIALSQTRPVEAVRLAAGSGSAPA
jgi:hypothetical protein